MLVLPAAARGHVPCSQGTLKGCGASVLDNPAKSPTVLFADVTAHVERKQHAACADEVNQKEEAMNVDGGPCEVTADDFLVPDPPEPWNLDAGFVCEAGSDDNISLLLGDPCELNDWLEDMQRSESSADFSDPGTLSYLNTATSEREGIPRCISLPNVQLCQGNSLPCSPVALERVQVRYVNALQSMQFPRSLSSGCLLSSQANGQLLPNVQSMPEIHNVYGFDCTGMNSTIALPTIWPPHNAPKRKGKGGRQPALDPRLDPNVDPKKARRILANRISAAKSKLKQKSEIEVLRMRMQDLYRRKADLENESKDMHATCSIVEDQNEKLRAQVKLLKEIMSIQDTMRIKLVKDFNALTAKPGEPQQNAGGMAPSRARPQPIASTPILTAVAVPVSMQVAAHAVMDVATPVRTQVVAPASMQVAAPATMTVPVQAAPPPAAPVSMQVAALATPPVPMQVAAPAATPVPLQVAAPVITATPLQVTAPAAAAPASMHVAAPAPGAAVPALSAAHPADEIHMKMTLEEAKVTLEDSQ